MGLGLGLVRDEERHLVRVRVRVRVRSAAPCGNPEASADSPSSTPRHRQVKLRAASRLGQPRPELIRPKLIRGLVLHVGLRTYCGWTLTNSTVAPAPEPMAARCLSSSRTNPNPKPNPTPNPNPKPNPNPEPNPNPNPDPNPNQVSLFVAERDRYIDGTTIFADAQAEAARYNPYYNPNPPEP